MGVFEQFPYVNFHELNLDNFLAEFQAMNEKIAKFDGISAEDLAEALADYVTQAALTSTLAGYVTDGDLDTTLADYVTDSELSTALTNYITSGQLTTALADYVTDSELSTELADYVTDTELSTALTNYITSGQLQTALNNYVTSGQLTTTLADYVTGATLATTLNAYVSKEELYDAMNYSAGDTFRVGGNTENVGHITNSADRLIYTIYLPKSAANLTAAVSFPGTLTLRTVNGAKTVTNAMLTGATAVVSDTGYNIEITVNGISSLSITNNTPCDVIGVVNVTFS